MRIAKAHRADLDPRDVMRVDGIPCTTPARTIVDAATVLGREALGDLVDDLLCRRLASAPFVLDVAARSAVGAGMPLLREVLDAWSLTIKPGSPAEVRALRLLEQWGFSRAVTQHEVRRPDGTLIGKLDLAFPAFREGATASGSTTRDAGGTTKRATRSCTWRVGTSPPSTSTT